ncbi:hypothetical protein GMST_09920 [Geomonas silvestris]|uniref:Fibronectin type-III domain-containing protein n=1 Tax=Geomonas silvestris TaxID=2740184 RepID=A0A6V8MFB2_9BACT|nr:fibronectin type III domain-containing protein [Geomonas silvestris]GFO58667.1 hypothetical protein GMST_09920 [Geomonas silvestris]
MSANDIFVMNFHKMTPRELITWCLGTAALQEKHPFHGSTFPDWVHGARHFREHAATLSDLETAAENKDTLKMKQRDEEQAATFHSIDINTSYLVLRAKAAKDNSLLYGMGYEVKEVKEKTKRPHQHVSVSRDPLKLEVERADDGAVRLKIQRDLGAGGYQVQFCKGQPTGEDSWRDYANFKTVRPLIKNLERACWYFFRVRSHGDNETSPWSAVVGIIVT